MRRVDILKPVYVQYIPSADFIREGELYISREFQTAVHKCCCGCGEEVVTPLNSAQWQIHKVNGKITVNPSIGNWSYPCRSHYLIRNNRIVWAAAFSEAQVKRVQEGDRRALEQYIERQNTARETGARFSLSSMLGQCWKWLLELLFKKR